MGTKLRQFKKNDVMIVVLVFLTLCGGLKSHGFSLNAWRHILEIKSSVPFSIGPPRGIRGDDWMVNFTFWSAQAQSNPKNPQVNRSIGYGQDLALSPFVFVMHWSSFFKPHLWGFFFDVDLGMSWVWYFLSFGIFLCVYLLLLRILPGTFQPETALLMALAFLFSNFFQFWSLVSVPSFLYGGIAFLAFFGFFHSKGLRLLLNIVLLVWSLTCFGFVFYPPFQIPSAHLLLISLALLAFVQIKTEKKRSEILFLVLLGCVCGVVALALFGMFLHEKREVVQLLLSTVYPGKRLILGGNLSLIRLVQDTVFPFLTVSDFSHLGGNICEAAGFLNFFPLVFVLYLLKWNKLESSIKPIVLFFGGYQILIWLWWLFGVPEWVAKVTGLSMVPSVRASGTMGVTHLVLLSIWFHTARTSKEISDLMSKSFIRKVWYLLVAAIIVYTFVLSADFSSFPWPQKLASLVLMTSITLLGNTIIDVNLRGFARGFAALSVLLTFFFNPIVFGGGESLMKASPLIQEIRNVEKRGPEGAWIAFDHLITGHAPLLAGSRSFSGVYLYPDLKLWKVLDPSGQYNHAWNRYAHVVFELDPAAKTPRISTPQGDVVIVATALDSPVLLQLPFSYVMIPISKADQIPKRLYREEARTRDWILAVRLQKN